MSKLQELKEKAKKATPGVWEAEGHEVLYDNSPYATENGYADCRTQVCRNYEHSSLDDIKYIAAANPAYVLKLIAFVEADENHTLAQQLSHPKEAIELARVAKYRARKALEGP